MAIYIKPSWRKYLPEIEVYINFPLIRIQTLVFKEHYDLLAVTYLGLFWKIWKWEGNIRIFETGNRFNSLSVQQDDVLPKRCGCWVSDKYKLKFYCERHWIKLLSFPTKKKANPK